MKKLLKSYGIATANDYYAMCLDSVINGQKSQAKDQFFALPKGYKKEMVRNLITQGDQFLPEHVLFFYDLL